MADTISSDAQGIISECVDESQRQVSPDESVGLPDRTGRQEWPAEPDVGRVAYGVAFRVDRLKALGNGQVPLCAAMAWILLTEGK